jgi:hypothetical protein
VLLSTPVVGEIISTLRDGMVPKSSKSEGVWSPWYQFGTPVFSVFSSDFLLKSRHVEGSVGGLAQETGHFSRVFLMPERLHPICQPGWDHHSNLHQGLKRNCTAVDQPTAALLADLEQRGLLDETLVLFGSEFGRQPTSQGADGRDHNITGYAMFLSGAGVKKGFSYGATDEYGLRAVEGRLHTNDLHATLLALLGLDHEKLTYRYAGRDFRLTDVAGRVVHEIFA